MGGESQPLPSVCQPPSGVRPGRLCCGWAPPSHTYSSSALFPVLLPVVFLVHVVLLYQDTHQYHGSSSHHLCSLLLSHGRHQNREQVKNFVSWDGGMCVRQIILRQSFLVLGWFPNMFSSELLFPKFFKALSSRTLDLSVFLLSFVKCMNATAPCTFTFE